MAVEINNNFLYTGGGGTNASRRTQSRPVPTRSPVETRRTIFTSRATTSHASVTTIVRHVIETRPRIVPLSHSPRPEPTRSPIAYVRPTVTTTPTIRSTSHHVLSSTTIPPTPAVRVTTPAPTVIRRTTIIPGTTPPIVKYGVPGPTTTAPVPVPVPAYGIPGPVQLDRYYAELKDYDATLLERKMSEMVDNNKKVILQVSNDYLGSLKSNRISYVMSLIDSVETKNDELDGDIQARVKPAMNEISNLQDLLEEREKIKKQISSLQIQYQKIKDEYSSIYLINGTGSNNSHLSGEFESGGNNSSLLQKRAEAEARVKQLENQLYAANKKLQEIEKNAYASVDKIHKFDEGVAIMVPVPEYGVIPASTPMIVKYGVFPAPTPTPMIVKYGVYPATTPMIVKYGVYPATTPMIVKYGVFACTEDDIYPGGRTN